MFGYIRPAARRLSEQENDRFRAVYCGLCHDLGRRYGFFARFLLNFDFTFLAILLFDGNELPCENRRCAVHPCAARCVAARSAALDLAADDCVILSWWQLQDHISDHGFFSGLPYRFAALLLRRAYRRARACAPDFDKTVRLRLQELGEREKEHCSSIDAASEPFAELLAAIAESVPEERKRRILRLIFYHLGRWIYLVDAADDFEKDAKSGNYNPLRYRYGAEGDKLPEETRRALARTLDDSVRQMAGAYALSDCSVWTPILDSIFYESFYVIGTAVLQGTYHKPKRALAGRAPGKETV